MSDGPVSESTRENLTPPASLVDPDQLAMFFRTVPALAASLPIRDVQRVGGGQSNVTCRVTLAE